MMQDHMAMPHTLQGETIAMARSALRYGRPDSLTQSHIVKLTFRYKPDGGPRIQDRMRFENAQVVSFVEQLEQMDTAESREPFLRARSQIEQGNIIPSSVRPSALLNFLAIYECIFRIDGALLKPHLGALPSPVYIDIFLTLQAAVFPLGMEEGASDFFEKLDKRALNPDWKGFFRRAWESPSPLGQYRLCRMDFLESEDPVSGKGRVRNVEKLTKAKLNAVGIEVSRGFS